MAEQEKKRFRSKENKPEHIMRRMEEVYYKFGRELNFYRHNAGLKMYEVVEKLGWPRTRNKHIGKIEDARVAVKFATMLEIAALFGYTLEIKWVKMRAVKPVESYDDIANGNKNGSEIELLGGQTNGSVVSEPKPQKEENEYHPPG